VDDSKFEREQMKNYNPSVCVIETPEDPKDYIKAIDDTGFFYLNSNLTKEDLKKKNQYFIIKKAAVLKKSSANVDEYLKQLNMTLTISKVNNINFTRCVQMLNKTNQFNFTTQRFTDSTFKKYLDNNKIKTLVISLKDKFGDHGITGLLTAKIAKESLILDNFLISCRVLGRKVEDYIIYEALNIAIKSKLKYLVGIYKKTTKNIQCEDFYIRKNFLKKNNTQYVLNTNNIKFKKLNFFKVIKKSYE
jgi:FkbH-like protein